MDEWMDGWAVSRDGTGSYASKPAQEYQHKTKVKMHLGL